MAPEVIVVGAGPYGVSATAYLRSAGVEVGIIGDPMSFWRAMPERMLLRSNRTATSMVHHAGPYSIVAHAAATGTALEMPYPLGRFVAYGEWVQQQVASDVDRRRVEHVTRVDDGFALRLEDGDVVHTRRVVIATGIADFPRRPPVADGLDPRFVSHTADHADLSTFAGRSVLVVGGGQSALESAALLHESGADVQVVVRAPRDHLAPRRQVPPDARLVLVARVRADRRGSARVVATGGRDRPVPSSAAGGPRPDRTPLRSGPRAPPGCGRGSRVSRSRSAGAWRPSGSAGEHIRAGLDDGSERVIDHVLFGTGYAVDLARYPFLDPELLRDVRRRQGYPLLGHGFETSVPGLHVLGAPAARSFGPTMRFVSGSWYAGRHLARAIAGAPRERTVEHVGAY